MRYFTQLFSRNANCGALFLEWIETGRREIRQNVSISQSKRGVDAYRMLVDEGCLKAKWISETGDEQEL